MKGSVLGLSLGGERFGIQVEGNPELAAWLRRIYRTKGGAPRAIDVSVRREKGGHRLHRRGRFVRRCSSQYEISAYAEWALTCEAMERLRRAKTLMHAGWVGLGGAGVLLVGAHGCGKTSLAMALSLGHAADVWGDDIVALSEAGGVRALERPVRLKPGSLSALPRLARLRVDRAPWRRGWPVLVPLSRLRRPRAGAPRLRLVVILGPWKGRALQVRRLEPAMAVAQMAKFVWNFRAIPREALRTLAAVARRSRVVRVAGGTVEERARAVVDLAR